MPDPNTLTAAQAASVKFDQSPRRRPGYNMGQVDAYVDAVSARMFDMEAQIAQLRDTLAGVPDTSGVAAGDPAPLAEPAATVEPSPAPEAEPASAADAGPEPASDTGPVPAPVVQPAPVDHAAAAARDILREASTSALAVIGEAEEDAAGIRSAAAVAADEVRAAAAEAADNMLAEARAEAERLSSETVELRTRRDDLRTLLSVAADDLATLAAGLDADAPAAGQAAEGGDAPVEEVVRQQ